MPNIGGQANRKKSRSAPSWTVNYTLHRSGMDQRYCGCHHNQGEPDPQRTAALRAIWTYRTVLDAATLVLTSTPSADHIGLERCRMGSRMRAEIEPGELRPSKAAVKREERNATIPHLQAFMLLVYNCTYILL